MTSPRREGREGREGRDGPGPSLTLIVAGVMLLAVVLLGAGPVRSGSAAGQGTSATVAVLSTAGLLAGLFAVGYGGWALWRLFTARRIRAAQAAAELAARAVADERLRIARELHDVVAHSMGVIAVKAGTARYLLTSRPEEAGAALEVIETASRGALAEMRQMLGLLRPGAQARSAATAELQPLPDLNDLPSLVDYAAAAGVLVTLEVVGTGKVPAGVSLSAYRIVQEAITNVVKHAAPARCQVSVRADGPAVTILVRDDGSRAVGPVPGHGGPGSGPGHGLIGMRERAEMHGGTFSAGPAGAEGFTVHATLPFEPA